jgi:DNA-binding NtrC family response regulator
VSQACILVVDDEKLIRWSLKERLEAEGYRVIEAESGGRALELFGTEVDLVLLDLRLPDVDGLSVLKRTQNLRPGAPVILMTAYGTPETLREALASGARRVVSKPFDFDEMLSVITDALPRHASRTER